MPDGLLFPEQEKALAPLLKKRVVTDFGAGDLQMARTCLRLGAKHVIAVDKAPWGKPTKRITVVAQYFHQYRKPIDVLLLSWPINHHCAGLIEAVARAETVVYLGKNTDGSACGTPLLFSNLLVREVLVHVPHYRNTLIVYGGSREQRMPLFEEMAGIDLSVIYPYAVYHDDHERRLRAPAHPSGASALGEAQLR